MSAQDIFICYRREDSAAYAGRITDHLTVAFPGRIFSDIEVSLGADFEQTIQQAVGTCKVVLVIIGEQWFFSSDSLGNRRLDDPKDFVRLEIRTALEAGCYVIPVLVGSAPMPYSDSIPEIQKLYDRQAYHVSDDDFRADMKRL